MTLIRDKEMYRRRLIFAICFFVATCIMFIPTFAPGVSELIMSMFSVVLGSIATAVIAGIAAVAEGFLGAMSFDVTYDAAGNIISANQTYIIIDQVFTDSPITGVLEHLGMGIATFILLWSLFTFFFGPFIGSKPDQSIGGTLGRYLIFAPLTYLSHRIGLALLTMVQRIYSSILNTFDASDVFGNMFDAAFGEFSDGFTSAIGNIGGAIMDAAFMATVGMVISMIALVVVLWNFIKLLIEAAQRFVAIIVYIYLSPLAVGCGVGANSINITKQAGVLLFSSFVLWILNLWCISIALHLISLYGASLSGISDLFIWITVTYAFLRIAQQLDDIFNAVGATNVRFNGSLLQDLLELDRMGSVGSGFVNGMKNFRETGSFSGTGSSSNAPVQGGKQGIANGGTAGAAAAGAAAGTAAAQKKTAGGSVGHKAPDLKTRADGSVPVQKSALDKAKDAYKHTPVGSMVAGIGHNITKAQTAFANMKNDGALLQTNEALNRTHTALDTKDPVQKQNLMKDLHNTGALQNSDVKKYVGQAMGLKSNQSVVGLSGESGQLTAQVATHVKGANGQTQTQISNVSGLNDMKPVGSATTTTSAAGTPQTKWTESTGGTNLRYQDNQGNNQMMSVSQSGTTPGSGSGKDYQHGSVDFSIGEGTAPIQVPVTNDGYAVGTNIKPTAKGVADAINGDNYLNVPQAHIDSAHSSANMNSKHTGTVFEGETPNYIPDNSVVTFDKAKGGSFTVESAGMRDDGQAAWAVTNSSGSTSVFTTSGHDSLTDVSKGLMNNDSNYSQINDFVGGGKINDVHYSAQAVESTPSGYTDNGTTWDTSAQVTTTMNNDGNSQNFNYTNSEGNTGTGSATISQWDEDAGGYVVNYNIDGRELDSRVLTDKAKLDDLTTEMIYGENGGFKHSGRTNQATSSNGDSFDDIDDMLTRDNPFGEDTIKRTKNNPVTPKE